MDSLRRASSQVCHSNQYQAMVNMFFRNSFINRCPSVFRRKTFKITNSRKYIFLQIWAINEIFSQGAYFILQNKLITRLLLHCSCKTKHRFTGQLRTPNTPPTPPYFTRNVHSSTLVLFRFYITICLPQIFLFRYIRTTLNTYIKFQNTYPLISSVQFAFELRLFATVLFDLQKHISENETKPIKKMCAALKLQHNAVAIANFTFYCYIDFQET